MLLYLSHIKEKTFQFFLSIPLYCPGGNFPHTPFFIVLGEILICPLCPGEISENLAYKIIIYFNKLLFNIYYI